MGQQWTKPGGGTPSPHRETGVPQGKRKAGGTSHLFTSLSQLCGKAPVSRGRPSPTKTSFFLWKDANMETHATLSHHVRLPRPVSGAHLRCVGEGRERCSPAKEGLDRFDDEGCWSFECYEGIAKPWTPGPVTYIRNLVKVCCRSLLAHGPRFPSCTTGSRRR